MGRGKIARELFDQLNGCITKDNEVEPVDPMRLKGWSVLAEGAKVERSR